MPIWNNQRKARRRASITAESLNASKDGGFWGDDLDDLLSSDFTPLIAHSSDDHAAEDEDVSEPTQEQQPPKAKEGGGRMRRGSLVKAMSFRPGGRNNSDQVDPSIMSPAGKRAPPQKAFSLPRTSRFAITRKLSSKVDSTNSSIASAEPASIPLKKKRSYLAKRSTLAEVKERKDDVALSLQKYLDTEPEEEKKASDCVKEEEEQSVTPSVSKSHKAKTSSSRHKSSKSSSSSRDKESSSASLIDEMKSPRKSSSTSKSSHSRGDKDPKKEKKERKRSTKSSSKSSSSSSVAPTTPRASPMTPHSSGKTPKSAGTHLDLTGMNTALMKPLDDMKASQRSESTELTEGSESTFSYPAPIVALI